MKKNNLMVAMLMLLSLAQNIFAQEQSEDLFDLTLEQLMNMEVSVASKKSESIKGLPSSVYVISATDIERSPATNLTELLREVPGYWGVQNEYMNTSAFMRNDYSGSVLVLLDGTPMNDLMYSSFNYDNFELPLSQIERIEIIKGSGGTVYGANSATGVISIVTKNADNLTPISATAKMASPSYAEGSVNGGKQFGGRTKIAYYGNYKHFGGYDQAYSGFEGSKYTEDDNTTKTYSAGFNLAYKANEKLNLSAAFHYSGYQSNHYYSYSPIESSVIDVDPSTGEFQLSSEDVAFFGERNNSHLIGNIRADYEFSDYHSLFVRVSTDRQNVDQPSAGGFTTNNGIIDVEVQDNFKLAFNNFSVGVNYRSVNYDINNITHEHSIAYTDKENTETLTSFFAQDKMTFWDDQFSLYIGAKFENFSLLNSKYYFSPMAKIVYMPNNKFTAWGGYSLSYTTPGYNQTNIELNMFRAEMNDLLFYQYLQENKIEITEENIEYYQAVLESTDLGVAAIPSSHTDPSSFRTAELGVRWQILDNLHFETNAYYTWIKNGLINSPVGFGLTQSNNYDDLYIMPFYYGNYMKGNNWGAESIIKYQANSKLLFELSHSLYIDELYYQNNDDFEIDDFKDDRIDDNEYPTVPENVFRAKAYIDLPYDFKVTLTGLYATAYRNRFGGIESPYQEDMERFEPLYQQGYKTGNEIGANDNRTVFNFRIDRSFMNNSLNLFIFGNDVFSSPFVESVNQLQTVYPRQVGNMFGAGITYTLH
ncbi:TonB-dependent receptor plug domain-containing protein [Saccharicrinis aurantiacus]|uniref:TonB-dependent receptor plug domain-containing protein n=1 Tax=Saccharicrinis aurantiacus TaxID=1849719 RepID=UPI00249399B3|nr:TonB-dependent receptor [Saccharicrinis aurantiacus]